MIDESKIEYVKYRIERAKDTIKEAEYLRDGGFYNAAINRLYYSCFYSAMALFMCKGIETKTHVGVKSQLSKEFIKTGIIDSEFGVTFGTLFNKRHSSDYDDFIQNDLQTVNDLIPAAESFINEMERQIKAIIR